MQRIPTEPESSLPQIYPSARRTLRIRFGIGSNAAYMGVKTKCTKEEQRQKDRYPVYIRRLAARHPRTHRETKCYFGDTFVLHLNQI